MTGAVDLGTGAATGAGSAAGASRGANGRPGPPPGPRTGPPRRPPGRVELGRAGVAQRSSRSRAEQHNPPSPGRRDLLQRAGPGPPGPGRALVDAPGAALFPGRCAPARRPRRPPTGGPRGEAHTQDDGAAGDRSVCLPHILLRRFAPAGTSPPPACGGSARHVRRLGVGLDADPGRPGSCSRRRGVDGLDISAWRCVLGCRPRASWAPARGAPAPRRRGGFRSRTTRVRTRFPGRDRARFLVPGIPPQGGYLSATVPSPDDLARRQPRGPGGRLGARGCSRGRRRPTMPVCSSRSR